MGKIRGNEDEINVGMKEREAERKRTKVLNECSRFVYVFESVLVCRAWF